MRIARFSSVTFILNVSDEVTLATLDLNRNSMSMLDLRRSDTEGNSTMLNVTDVRSFVRSANSNKHGLRDIALLNFRASLLFPLPLH